MRFKNYFQNFSEYRPNGIDEHRPNADNDSRRANHTNRNVAAGFF